MKKAIILILAFIITNCATLHPNHFTLNALTEKLQTSERTEITLQEIVEKNKGKKSFVEIFATYCPVSKDSFYDVEEFQKKHPKINYIFLSVDHSFHDWKRGLKNIKPKGQFYYIQKKGKGELGKFLKLKTIPRFLVIDENGEILVFKSSKLSEKIKNQILK